MKLISRNKLSLILFLIIAIILVLYSVKAIRLYNEYHVSESIAPHNSDITGEMDSIISEIVDLKRSTEYISMNSEERKTLLLDKVYYIADNGTSEFPYPLIEKESITTDGNVISFNLLNGESCSLAFY